MVADAGPMPAGGCFLPLLGERMLLGMARMVLYSRLLSARSFIITCKPSSSSDQLLHQVGQVVYDHRRPPTVYTRNMNTLIQAAPIF